MWLSVLARSVVLVQRTEGVEGKGVEGGRAEPHVGRSPSLDALRAVVEGWDLAPHGDEVVEALVLLDRLTALLHRDVGSFDEARLWEDDGATSMTAWLRTHGGLTRSDAARTVSIARRLRRWPATARAWQAGQLAGGQVQAISANVGHEHVDRFGDDEDDLVPALSPLSVTDTGIAMAEWRARVDATDGGGRGRREPRRHLHLSPMLDGRHRIDGELDAEGAAVVLRALSLATGRPAPGDPPRRPAERRADALVEVCRRGLAERALEPGRRQRPHINVTVDLLDIGRGRLDDGAPLDPSTIHRLLCDANVHRFVTAGRSVVLDYGTATRTVSPGLFQALVVRDGGCRWPGCDRPHAWCEAHHVVSWQDGGPTSPANLVLLCARHHHLAHGQHGHRRGWRAALADDGSFVVTSPDGRVARSRPPP